MSWHVCPKCGKDSIRCYDSRFNAKVRQVRRRYHCEAKSCKARFTTIEEVSHVGQLRGPGAIGSLLDREKQKVMARIERALKRM